MKSKEVSIIKRNNMYTRLVTSCVFILSIIFSGWSATWGVAEALTIHPKYLMTHWEKNGHMDDLNAWKTALESLELANRINPGNPDILFDMACLFEWRALQRPIWTTHAIYYRSESISKYRQVLEKRPTWALAWASLAQNKFLIQEADQEMWDSMRNAINYAPWEIAVQRKIVWLGIATWKFNSKDLRVHVKKIIVGSLRNSYLSDFVLKTAVQYQWEENLITLLDKHQEMRLRQLIQIRG